jgi:hypothetical protein
VQLVRQWRLGLGQNLHEELVLYRGKSYELVAEVDSSLSLLKISTESRRSELDEKGKIRFGDELGTGLIAS